MESVKQEALRHIDSGEDLLRWNTFGNEKNFRKRKAELEKLKKTAFIANAATKKDSQAHINSLPVESRGFVGLQADERKYERIGAFRGLCALASNLH